MKRLTFIFTLLVCVLQSCAQLEKTDYDRGIIGLIKEEIVPYRLGFVCKTYITQDGYGYYLISQDYERITNSDYDIPDHKSQTSFCLGEDRRSAVKTLKAVRNFVLLHKKGKGIDVNDCNNVVFHIHKTQNNEVYISSTAHNNLIKLTTKDIKYAISLIQK